MVRLILWISSVFLLSGCLSSKKYENINYLSKHDLKTKEPKLNIFVPNKLKKPAPVFLFVHGGNWNSGDKETYNLVGRHLAAKGMIAVIPGYNLSPDVNYDTMAEQIGEAINWTHNHISNYGGDTSRLFLSGHSAGGHLVALATMNPKYAVKQGHVAGIILNDAAGLDMHHYLQEKPPTKSSHYITTWSKDPEVWKAASPIYYINEHNPPFMIYLGEKTYESIKVANRRFVDALEETQPNVEVIKLNKKHVPMMVQFFNPWSKRYKEIKSFMKRVNQ